MPRLHRSHNAALGGRACSTGLRVKGRGRAGLMGRCSRTPCQAEWACSGTLAALGH